MKKGLEGVTYDTCLGVGVPSLVRQKICPFRRGTHPCRNMVVLVITYGYL